VITTSRTWPTEQAKTTAPIGSGTLVREIYKRFADGDDTAALIAADFGISRSEVAAIGNGTAWQHLGLPPVHRGLQWQRRQRNHRCQFA
jgi:hypothetical protein